MNEPTFTYIPVLTQTKTLAFTGCLTESELAFHTPILAERLHKRLSEVRIGSDTQDFFNSFPDLLHFVALISEEDPDTLATLPIWMRICRASTRFDLRIVLDTNDFSALTRLLDGADINSLLEEHDLPQVFIFDDEWTLQAQWGPRPQAAESYLDKWFSEHSDYETLGESDLAADQERFFELNEELIQQMRIWYNSGLNQDCMVEIRGLLAELREEVEEENGNDEPDR